jgi:phosphatidylinositol glycan class A protein
MTYRKGVDLLVDIIPAISKGFRNVRWILGGDGPKLLELQQMVEHEKLHDRVELLGRVEHSKVCDVLRRGHIFLNCSLTEAFCIALIEAACCGLSVVSTNVGGIPEVLPPDLVHLADPRADKLAEALTRAIGSINERPSPIWLHEQIKRMYSWETVASRTEKVYNLVLSKPKLGMTSRIYAYLTCGTFGGALTAIYVVIDYFLALLFEWFIPRASIELMPQL